MRKGSQSRESAVAIILAGGQGQRLVPLTNNTAKPAVRFGGSYRMIDFTLSNCINSGLHRIYLPTQYASSSLHRHVRKGFAPLLSDDLGEFIELVPPQRVFAERWYAGTADAVFQNLNLLEQERPDDVILLAGDHAYKMDYSVLLDEHRETGASLTITCLALPRKECTQLGVVRTDSAGRVEEFVEKPADPAPMPDDPEMSLVSMAVYVWRTETLVKQVSADARRDSNHDFGRDIIPGMVEAGEHVHASRFRSVGDESEDYWRDIGTLTSYWEAHMDLVGSGPKLNFYDPTWPIYTHRPVAPPAKLCSGGECGSLELADCIVSPGCVISGSMVKESVLSPGVSIRDAHVEQSILMDDVTVSPGARVRRAIVAEGVAIPADTSIGYDLEHDRRRFVVTEDGIAVLPTRILLDQ